MLNESAYHPTIANIVESGTSAEQVLKHFRKMEDRCTMEPKGYCSQGGDYAPPDSKVSDSGLEREVGLKEK